jgi:hypothetical protein
MAYLQQSDSAATGADESGDELDWIITNKQLKISRFLFFRELDLLLVILNNRRVITQTPSAYPFMLTATDEQLMAYEISATGIHWPALDADLSLRGFLLTEVTNLVL